MRRILGIDPGSRITGYGVLEIDRCNQVTCLTFGSIVLGNGQMPVRLYELYQAVHEISQKFLPTELAVEQVFVHKNVRSALKLGQARGVAIAAAMHDAMHVFEYAPRQIKQAIVGRGSALKGQMQHMIKVLLSLEALPQADAADALSVALCHAHSAASQEAQVTSSPAKRRNKRSHLWKNYDRTTSR